MDHALINRLYNMLGPYAMDIKDDARDLGNPTFLQAKILAMAEWGHSTPQDRDNNLNGLSAKWHPSQGVKQLFRRGKEAIAYSVKTGHNIPDNIIDDKLIRFINGSH